MGNKRLIPTWKKVQKERKYQLLLQKNLINLNADQKNNVIEFLNMLEEDDDVQKFYINLDLKGL